MQNDSSEPTIYLMEKDVFSSWSNFLDSQFFVALVSLLVGFVAFSIYKRQKRDAKRDAANIILLEIENAEQQLQKVTAARADDLNKLPNMYLMNEPSWNKYRYLFVKDFDRNEWDKINDFYSKCQSFDEAVIYNESHFDKNVQQIRENTYKHIGYYANEFAQNTYEETNPKTIRKHQQTMDKKKAAMLEAIGINKTSNIYLYSPQQPLDQATLILINIESNLSLTSVGQKLKAISFRKSWWQSALGKITK